MRMSNLSASLGIVSGPAALPAFRRDIKLFLFLPSLRNSFSSGDRLLVVVYQFEWQKGAC